MDISAWDSDSVANLGWTQPPPCNYSSALVKKGFASRERQRGCETWPRQWREGVGVMEGGQESKDHEVGGEA